MSSHQLFSLSTELVELKIEEFLTLFGEKLNSLTEEAFNTQVCVRVCVKMFSINTRPISVFAHLHKFAQPKRPQNKA